MREERSAFLARECGEDETLRGEVESLLAHYRQATNFLEASLPQVAAGVLVADHNLLAEGRVIGNYTVIACLGTGGMGEVYLALDMRLNRKVALKVMPAGFFPEATRLIRFEQEARAASALNHPNIITIHEIGESDGIRFMTTEFIEGQTLRQRMAATRMTLAEALDVASQTACALTAAHDAGIVHCDIKPDNIMVRRDGFVKVLDFGLARLIEPGTHEDGNAAEAIGSRSEVRSITGTPRYMSPEQARGQDVDARSDIFSLGIVLFEMITGRRPFEGTTAGEVITSILGNEHPPLRSLAVDIPDELERIIGKALAKDKEERYRSSHELFYDLHSLQHELRYWHRSEPRDPEEGPVSIGLHDERRSRQLNPTAQPKSPPPAALPAALDASVESMDPEWSAIRTGHYRRVAAVSLLALVAWIGAFADMWGAHGRSTMVRPQAGIEPLAVRPAQNSSGNPEVYAVCLKGRYYWNERSLDGYNKGLELYRHAIELNPAYAPAYAGVALCYDLLGLGMGSLPPIEAAAEAKTAGRIALELDGNLADAHAALAFALHRYDWDWAKAEKEYKRAIELDPNQTIFRVWSAGLLKDLGREEEAQECLRQARDVDPSPVQMVRAIAGARFESNQYAEGIAYFWRAVESDPDNFRLRMDLAARYRESRHYEEAVEEYRNVLALFGPNIYPLAELGFTYALSGKRAEAEGILDQLNKENRPGYASYASAQIYAALGRKEEALECLQKAYEEHAAQMVALRRDTAFASIRSDPRFRALACRVGLVPKGVQR